MAKTPRRQGGSGPSFHRAPLFSDREWNAIVDKLSLPPRKAEILAMLLAGLRDDAIARVLGISKTTLRSHLSQLFDRLHVDSRLGLVVYVFFTYRRFVEGRDLG